MPGIIPDNEISPGRVSVKQFLQDKQPSVKDFSSIGFKIGVMLFNYRWFRYMSATFLCSIFVFGYIYSTYGKIMQQGHVSSVVSLVDFVAHFLLTIANLFAIVTIVQYEKYKSLNSKLILYIANKTATQTVFGIISTLFNVIALVASVCNGFVYISCFGWDFYKFYGFQDFQFSYLNFILATFSELTNCLKNMFKDVNEELFSFYRESFKSSQIETNISTIDILFATTKGNLKPNEPKINAIYLYKTKESITALRGITKKHNRLCQHMDDFNAYVGLLIFTSLVSIVANIIWAITILIEYDIHEVALEKFSPSTAVLVCKISSCLAWIFVMLGQIILFSSIGRKLTAEGRRTSMFCYQMLSLRTIKEDDQEGAVIRHQLTVLAKQAETRCPVLCAAGFFQFNLQILGLVASTVFAYCIVVLQFVLNKH